MVMIRMDKIFGVRSEKGLGHWATGLLATVAACCCCKPHLPTLFIFKVKFAGSLFKYSLLKYFLIALKMRQLRKLWIWVWNWMKSPPKIANYWEKWTYNQVVIISEEHKSGVTEYFWAGWRLSSAYLQAAWNYLVFHQSSWRKMINTEFYPKGRVRRFLWSEITKALKVHLFQKFGQIKSPTFR